MKYAGYIATWSTCSPGRRGGREADMLKMYGLSVTKSNFTGAKKLFQYRYRSEYGENPKFFDLPVTVFHNHHKVLKFISDTATARIRPVAIPATIK